MKKILDNGIEGRLVKNIETGEFVEFSIKLTPQEALISAHAYLTLKDPDNNLHKAKYGGLIKNCGRALALGYWEVLNVAKKQETVLISEKEAA